MARVDLKESASEAPSFQYVGGELEIFRKASNWKRYWSSHVSPYLRGDVLEVGAGLGTNTELLSIGAYRSWTALEPDAKLTRRFPKLGDKFRLVNGTLADIDGEFDAILYIDVLEHIEDDREEMKQAVAHLKPGGTLIVLSPAHQFLFSPFDRAIGHYRRYSRESLQAVAPEGLDTEELTYLDSVGCLLSLGNRLLMRQSMPTQGQILFWDRTVVPLSQWLDAITFGRFGKTVLGIWRKPK